MSTLRSAACVHLRNCWVAHGAASFHAVVGPSRTTDGRFPTAAVIGDIVNNIETRSSNNPWLVTGPGAMSARYMAHLAAPGPDFAGIDVVEWEQLRPFVQMGAPQYKSLPDHWHTAYKTQSVFLPESERPTSWLERVRQRWSGRA
jgi:hypothetical protein